MPADMHVERGRSCAQQLIVNRLDIEAAVEQPAKAANVSTKNGLFRLPEALLTPAEMRPSWRVLIPGGVSGTVH